MRTETNKDRGRDRVVQIWLDIYNVAELNDLAERMTTPVESKELQEELGLTNAQMSDLRLACGVDAGYDLYSLPEDKADDLRVMIKEAIHQGLDGYTDEDRFVIYMFLNDLGYALKVEEEYQAQHG